MKKILFSLVIVGLIVLAVYLLLGRSADEDDQIPDTYIEFSPLHPEVSTSPNVTPDIRNILKEKISPALNKVVNSMYIDNYHVFECDENSGGGQVMILTAKYDGSIARGGYDGAYQNIKAWESNAVADIGHILFPSLSLQTAAVNFVWFEPYEVNNSHITAARDFHKAQFYIGDQSYEMHYGWILNYVVFAPSQDCLVATMFALYHDH